MGSFSLSFFSFLFSFYLPLFPLFLLFLFFLRNCDQDNLENEFIGAYASGGLESVTITAGRVAAGRQAGCCSSTQELTSLFENRNQKQERCQLTWNGEVF